MPDRSSKVVLDTRHRIKAFRNEEGLTQAKFAEMIGRKRNTIVRYESGDLSIPIDIIKELHDKFRMSYEWFFHGKGNRKAPIDRGNLITDISTLNENNLILQGKVEELERKLKRLIKDFYAEKHGVQSGDFAGTKGN